MTDPVSLQNSYTVAFEPMKKFITIKQGATVLEAARETGVSIVSSCGGTGRCGKCKVIILEGKVSSPGNDEKHLLSEEELLNGMRLACRTHVHGNVKIKVPKSSIILQLRLQTEGVLPAITLDPLIYSYTLAIPPPTLEDPRSDFERLAALLPGETMYADSSVIRQLPETARMNGWHLTAYMRDSEIIGVSSPGLQPLGYAVDLGTTKIAASLLNLENGSELAEDGVLNPQIRYGEDIISRLAYVIRNRDGGHMLASAVQDTLNDLLGSLLYREKLNRAEVADVCIAGNTAMTHLLLDLPIDQLAVSPYVAATGASITIKARELGITTAPGAYVHILPCIGGFVGADHVAMILSTRLDCTDTITLGIDIGTNTEIVLAGKKRGRLTAASCASGPAFEGAHILDGMRAAAGAIESVSLSEHDIFVKTIDDAPPVGLCGSGIIDIMAELRRFNIINQGGRFQQKHPRIRVGRHGPEFLLVQKERTGNGQDIVITQEDVNQIQLAKGAIKAGVEILCAAEEISREEVGEVVFAGAFGSYLNVQNALRIGLIPCFPNARYKQAGNGSLAGAKEVLLSKQARNRAGEIARITRYLELSTFPDFNHYFARGMFFLEEDLNSSL